MTEPSRAAYEALESALGHTFRDRELLSRALTHRSRGFDDKSAANNEQLEFLGDAILGFVISEELVGRYPTWSEGRLSKSKAWLVSSAHLLSVAQRLGLGQLLRLGRSEEIGGGRLKKTLLADAVEALIAAVYLDGGIEPARAFVRSFILADYHPEHAELENEPMDYKGALQEFAHARKLPAPHYVMLSTSGPEHAKTFTVEARLGAQHRTQADGFSKKTASQRAARMLLEQLRSQPET